MRYFLAYELPQKPFVRFQSVADFDTVEDFEESEFFGNPLIVAQEDIKTYIFGVYPDKIVAGELVERTVLEMATFEEEFNVTTAINNNKNRARTLSNQTFEFDSNTFPMDDGSRIFYQCIDKLRGNQKIMNTSGVLYDLIDTGTNINDFLAAYYLKLMDVTKHDI